MTATKPIASMNRLVFIVILYFVTTDGYADIAPTRFVGAGITPVDAPSIRMVSAKVDIAWGTPCTLSAVFILDNQTTNTTELELGFPVALPDDLRDKHSLAFGMSFDDVAEDPSKITEVGKPKANFPTDMTWYRCKYTFAPGQTKVAVTTKLPATLVYGCPYQESLFYCIETGRAWAGTIGYEEVNIHFPHPITKAEIYEASPDLYTINGDAVQWKFSDFKPQGEDHDVHLHYLRPDVMPILDDLRGRLKKDPTNVRTALELAKCLFVLGPYRGYGLNPPQYLDEAEHKEVVGKIKRPKDQILFKSMYTKQPDGSYKEKDEEWSPDRYAVVRMLSEIDYAPREYRSAFVDEAKELVEQVLKEHPQNASAWNIYLANYYRFHFAGDSFYPSEVHRINSAYANCPDDPCIRLWHKRAKFGEKWSTRSEQAEEKLNKLETTLQQSLEKAGIQNTSLPKLEYNYY